MYKRQVPAYAQSSEPQPETASAPAETEAEPETQNPFTPDGTGTVVDNATDEDGKEFYTKMCIRDRQSLYCLQEIPPFCASG